MYSVMLMTVFWDLIWGVLVGMFVANLLTVDAITQTQLQGMDDDNQNLESISDRESLSEEERQLIRACGNQLMLSPITRSTEFWRSQRNQCSNWTHQQL